MPTSKRKSRRKAPTLVSKGPSAKRAASKRKSKKLLPGPRVKRAVRKSVKLTTTKEKLRMAKQSAVEHGDRPLDGIRVLDLSRLLPGPYASHILASFGAEVIKIERPGEGDYLREGPPETRGVNAAFWAINRGKKSLAVDLKTRAGKQVFLALAEKADIVLDGFRPGVMDRLRLGYKQLSEGNPRLIYAALTGFGQTGKYSNVAAHDLNHVALSGLLDLVRTDGGIAEVPGIQIADVAAGALPTVIGVLLALQHRSTTGQGQLVDISMYDSVLGLMPLQIAEYAATKRRPKRGSERLFGKYACYNVYPVRNGRALAVAALEPKFWARLCEIIEREDLIDDQYVEGDAQEIVKAELTRTFQKREVADWMEIFLEHDVCVTEVRELSRAAQEDYAVERHMVVPERDSDGNVFQQLGVFPKLSAAPGYIEGDAPQRGGNSQELLESLEYSAAEIDQLIEDGVVEQA